MYYLYIREKMTAKNTDKLNKIESAMASLSFFVYYNMQYKLHLKQEKQGTLTVLNNLYKQ